MIALLRTFLFLQSLCALNHISKTREIPKYNDDRGIGGITRLGCMSSSGLVRRGKGLVDFIFGTK